ncbi:MAG TPA: alpha/beta hydrolase [Nevskiaceae bacterium]|nr:alpha/beta hydrolase [Nevskiaceae bacterium]
MADLYQRAFRTIESGGVKLRVAVEGKGPLVILLHGWPQGWFLWRHQIDPLVAAGYQVAVPDQRGYGGSDAPPAIEDYDIVKLTGDVANVATALGHERFVVVGHDWGSLVAWNTALLHEPRVRAVVGMSVPYFRYPVGTLTRQETFGANFWYMVYFQKPGAAEAELDRDLRRSITKIHWSLSAEAPKNIFVQPKPSTAKLLDGLPEPCPRPAGLSEADLDYIVAQYQRNGFRGPINWYRNLDRNMTITPQLEGRAIRQPALFVAGEKDVVLDFPGLGGEELWQLLPNLKRRVIVPGAGHWIPAERPAETTQALLDFLRELPGEA